MQPEYRYFDEFYHKHTALSLKIGFLVFLKMVSLSLWRPFTGELWLLLRHSEPPSIAVTGIGFEWGLVLLTTWPTGEESQSYWILFFLNHPALINSDKSGVFSAAT